MSVIKRFLRERLRAGGAEHSSDLELLDRFLQLNDEASFELLVHRHGAMVLGVCRRIIGNLHDAEDAFQATFLTLARRGRTIQRRQSLASWLYQVSYRLALRCRSRTRQHVPLDLVPEQAQQQAPMHDAEYREQAAALTEEVARLSERLRSVILLCCMQGKSSTEAARELGCPVNTIATRLFRAREQLRRNLGRRGILVISSLGTALGTDSASALTPAIAQSLASLAVRLHSGAALATLVPCAVTSLMKGSAMWSKPLCLLLAMSAALGLVSLTQWNATASDQPPQPSTQTPSQASAQTPFKIILPPQSSAGTEPGTVLAQFDVDDDGIPDLVETVTRGSGVLSTYYSQFQLTARSGYKMLRGGMPLGDKETLTAADLFNTVDSVHLCTDAGSLRVNLKPEEARSGPWSGKKAALALACLKGSVIYLGYVTLSVSGNGQITVLDSHFQPVQSNAIEITLNSQDDIADIQSKQMQIGEDASKKYMLISPREPAPAAPADGYGLVIILPGGDGGIGFHPFVKRIFKNTLPSGYLAVQPLPNKWSPQQQIVWPTSKNKVPGMKHSTEELINAVIDDVAARHKLNPSRVFTISWSSSGPAAYAVSLSCPKVTGSFIAMSVFNPRFLPALDTAKDKPYYLYHSPDDRVCPYRMAQQAVTDLVKAGAQVELKTYDGGHGWRGPMYDDIRTGITWLEKNAKARN